MNCLECNKYTTNRKYCSRSCAVAANNRKYIKRVAKPRNCVKCGNEYYLTKQPGGRSSYCPECRNVIHVDVGTRTLKEYKTRCKTKGLHRSWWYSDIRNHCRRINKHRPLRCQVCGYNRHVECAHITALADCDDSMTLNEINDPSNVAILCPNCHWEFDHNLLKL
jgi:hypothetical protein